MFVLNLGYRHSLASNLDDLSGVIYLAEGGSSERFQRSTKLDFRVVLFDPQLYLASLDARTCGKTCARLSTYPWFGVEGVPGFDSDAGNRTAWEKLVEDRIVELWPSVAPADDAIESAAKHAIEFQAGYGCTHIILPSPLLSEREDEAESLGRWLDAGLRVAQAIDVPQPLLATVAISEGAINDAAFDVGGFLDTIADQVTARTGFDGVYILVAQTGGSNVHPFETTSRVLRAYLRLCRTFARSGHDPVLCNYADVFGLACTAVGATIVAGGPSHKLRRMSLANYREEGGGLPLPRFYSHRVVGEFAPERDLPTIAAKRLLRRVRDITRFSEPLLEALAKGGSAATLPQWAESRNNMKAANQHFVTRLALEASALSRMSLRDRGESVRDWLEEAAATGLLLQSRIAPESPGRLAPVQRWLDSIDAELADRGV